MTATKLDNETLATVTTLDKVIAFVREHGNHVGPVVSIHTTRGDGRAQVDTCTTDKAKAGGMLAWFYLLNDAKVSTFKADDGAAHTSVSGRISDVRFSAYTGFGGAAGAYLLGLDEVSVHSLRRIQIGDVPALDTEAVDGRG